MLTPLNADLSVDHGRLAAHGQALLAAGAAGLTPFGTTGEFASFSVAERRNAVDAMVAAGIPAAKIVISNSAAALPDIVELTRHALAIGAHGCLMLPPFYFKGVSDEGILDCYRQVIDAVADPRLRVYLYHIPQVSAVGLSHHVIATLKREYPEVIVGIKDSQCDTAHSVGLAEAFMKDVRVYVGNELDLPEMGKRGSTGAISGLANFMPRTVHALVTQPTAADTPARRERVAVLLQRLGGYALIPALKGIQATLSGDAAWLRVRAPLVALDAARAAEIAALTRELQLDFARD